MNLKVILRDGDDGWYVVEVPSLPGCISQGKTTAEALENIKEAIELHLEPEGDMISLDWVFLYNWRYKRNQEKIDFHPHKPSTIKKVI